MRTNSSSSGSYPSGEVHVEQRRSPNSDPQIWLIRVRSLSCQAASTLITAATSTSSSMYPLTWPLAQSQGYRANGAILIGTSNPPTLALPVLHGWLPEGIGGRQSGDKDMNPHQRLVPSWRQCCWELNKGSLLFFSSSSCSLGRFNPCSLRLR